MSLHWDINTLPAIVAESTSVRQVILKLGLVPAGGNYNHIKRIIKERGLSTMHFLGQRSNSGVNHKARPPKPLDVVLTKASYVQSYKLKKRLFSSGLKDQKCEECGWAKISDDGRIPVELDHINGDRYDNRIENLRILCPNCHSLKPTHRGKNINARVVEW